MLLFKRIATGFYKAAAADGRGYEILKTSRGYHILIDGERLPTDRKLQILCDAKVYASVHAYNKGA